MHSQSETLAIDIHDVPDLPALCRYLSERSPQPMLAVEGLTHIVRYVNPAFCEMAGKPASDLMGRRYAEAVPEGENNACIALLDRVFATGRPETLSEQEHGRNPPRFWSYAMWAVFGPDERPIGVMVEVTDSTETAVYRSRLTGVNQSLLQSSLRQQELTDEAEALNAQLKAANEAKDQFIAVLSHELRTPLGPVLAALAVLERDGRLGEDVRETLRMIGRNVALEARLIDDLLDITRIAKGKLELDRRPIDLQAVLDQAVEVCMPAIGAGGLAVQTHVEGGPYTVDADAVRMQQVFWNLVRNATKFTPKGGSIRVGLRRTGPSEVTVDVADTGIGIDSDLLPVVFDAFRQGRAGSTRRFGGLGLGLAISKGIVEMHGGEISAQSPGLGRGAVFSVRLPIISGAQPGSVTARNEGAGPRSVPPMRLLLVEDHPDTARTMRRLLELEGHSVECASDVAGGLKLAREGRFDLLLCDLGLPDGSGLDLMRALRKQAMMLPGIVLSGYGMDQDITESRAAGFATHLIKPVDPPRLWDAIAAVTA